MSNNSTLLQELDNEAIELISGGQRSQRPRVLYACSRDRYVTDFRGDLWFRGRRACRPVDYDDAPRRVQRELDNFRGNFD